MKRWRTGLTAAALLGASVVGAACGSDHGAHEMAGGTGQTTGETGETVGITNGAATPGDDSVEAGFARDMSTHHAQAVAMAEAIRDRTEDPDLRLLATDIALGQQNQIGRMAGWLDEWGLSIGTANPPMAWMGDAHQMDGPGDTRDTDATVHDAAMPGMATRPQVSALSTLSLAEAEISFLELMIAHHLGGVEMAGAALDLTERPPVVRLATSMITSQEAEITVMTDMLSKRGVTS